MGRNANTNLEIFVPFKFTGGKANEEACGKACAGNPECVAYSAQFGKWCIGCKEALSDDHSGAKAFKKKALVPDPDNDGKKCKYKPGNLRTFKFTGGKANEEACTKACADNPACVAYSAQFGKWCIGCKESLSDKHAGAKSFKKSGQGGGDGGGEGEGEGEGDKGEGEGEGDKGEGEGEGDT